MTEPPLLTRPFLLLVAGHLLQALGYASMLLLPLYVTHLGASRTETGTIMAMGAVGGLLLRPVAGWALDAVGRKRVLVMATLVLVAGMALVGLCDRIGPLIYVSRFLVGVGAGTLFAAYFTYAADLIPEARRTEGIALFGVSGLTPLVINPVAQNVGVDAPSLQWFFPLVGVLVLASLIPVAFLREAPRPASSPTDTAPWTTALRDRPLWSVWWATIVFAGGVSLFMAFVTVTASNRGVTQPANLWYAYAATAVLVRIVGPRLPARVGPHNIVAPALAGYGAAFLIAAAADTQAGFLWAGGLAGLGHGYCFPVLTAQVVDRSPVRLRGAAMAVFTALWELAAIGLTPLFGWIADGSDDATMFAVAAVLAAGGLAVWAALEARIPVPRRGGMPPGNMRGEVSGPGEHDPQ